jgi:hypothetical protein
VIRSREKEESTHLASRLLVLEQLTKVVARVVALDVLLGVDDAGGEVLLVRLTLEDWYKSSSRSAGVERRASEGETAHSSPRPCPSQRNGRRSLQMRVDQPSSLATRTKSTHNPSSDHHATRERAPAYRKRGSNLRSAPSSSQLSFPSAPSAACERRCSPGSNKMSLFAPMRLMPHPPALEERRKMNSLPSGSLNLSTSF